MQTFNVFVYGTLMRGFRANSFIPKEAKMLKGKIAGNLYHYSAGYPIVKILPHSQSVEGSIDHAQDISTQNNLNRVEPECLPFDLNYGRVYGELYQIPYDGESEHDVIKTLDYYEGFRPNARSSFYKRTLVPVETEEGIIWAWVYNMANIPSASVQILSGNWLDCYYSNRGGLRPEISRAIQIKTITDNKLDFEIEDDDIEDDEIEEDVD